MVVGHSPGVSGRSEVQCWVVGWRTVSESNSFLKTLEGVDVMGTRLAGEVRSIHRFRFGFRFRFRSRLILRWVGYRWWKWWLSIAS